MRLSIPCRAVTCTHLQCFDAALYLQMNEKKPTWICPVCDKKAVYESLILDGLFMEILNQCSDAEEIKFQEDGSWFPMRQKKETLNVSSAQCTKVESSSVFSKACSMTSIIETNRKKSDVIDLTIESSEEEEDPPPKKKCILAAETKESPAKGVFTYQPTTRIPGLTTIDSSTLSTPLSDYSMVPFHRSSMSSIPADLPGLDFLSLLSMDPQHYCSSMFLDSFPSGLPMKSLSGNLRTSTNNQESSALVSSSSKSDPEVPTSSASRSNAAVIASSSSKSETDVITSSGSTVADIISLD